MSKDETFKIRPAGRHIYTIGRDLIKDQYAAIVELVKNAYDADSTVVDVEINLNYEKKQIAIVVRDDGHGMSRGTVTGKWLVPSTSDKLERRYSKGKKRVMQGRKGVGRYAASLLGEELLLETSDGVEKTQVYLEWEEFSSAEFLDQVEVLVNTGTTTENTFTQLTITGGEEFLNLWGSEQLEKMEKELVKLVSPFESQFAVGAQTDAFEITLSIKHISEDKSIAGSIKKVIEPATITEHYDYRVAGSVAADGNGKLKISIVRAGVSSSREVAFRNDALSGCGRLFFDLRVFDREPSAIEGLIKKLGPQSSGNYWGKLEARRMLNEINGVRIYRGGFRVRPYGDEDSDWLKLNQRRVQNPSKFIGSNQIVGFIEIESEDVSGLIEKSARDGLRENAAFESLVDIAIAVLSKLEEERLKFRIKAGISRKKTNLGSQLDSIYNLEDLKKDVQKQLKKAGVNQKTHDEVVKIIEIEEKTKNKELSDIKQIVAAYQGQATIGKIMNIVLHEGRKPLSAMLNRLGHMKKWISKIDQSNASKPLANLEESIQMVDDNLKSFSTLFKRLDPLATGRRGRMKIVNIKNSISNAASLFEKEFDRLNVATVIEGSDDLTIMGWEQDMSAIFTNLIENSIYWMEKAKAPSKQIRIVVSSDRSGAVKINYTDTGPGIASDLIEDNVIFEPDFSTKPHGTGIGLAIAGEAAQRNGLILTALESEEGAEFQLQQIKG